MLGRRGPRPRRDNRLSRRQLGGNETIERQFVRLGVLSRHEISPEVFAKGRQHVLKGVEAQEKSATDLPQRVERSRPRFEEPAA